MAIIGSAPLVHIMFLLAFRRLDDLDWQRNGLLPWRACWQTVVMLTKILPNLSLVGESGGLWKTLPGYSKPSGLRSGAVSAPPPRLGEEEIQRIGEELFSAIRPAMGYKRRDLVFSRDAFIGVIAARDFELSLQFVSDGEADGYQIRKTMSAFRDAELFRHAGFNQVFSAMFHRMEFRPPESIRVEEWIDRVEDRDLEEEWSLKYPSDYSSCRLSLPKTDFSIEVTADMLAIHRLDPAPPLLYLEQLDRLGVVWSMMETP